MVAPGKGQAPYSAELEVSIYISKGDIWAVAKDLADLSESQKERDWKFEDKKLSYRGTWVA